MNKLLKKLSGGDLRSDRKGSEIAEEVIKQPDLLVELIEGLESSNKIIRMRTTHTLKVISRTHPQMIEEIKHRLINSVHKDEFPEARWHLAQIFGNIY